MTFEEAIREADREWEARVIPDGKEMNWKGHKLRFELSPSDCVGCFFKDKDECPECDDGAWVEDSPWCTGEPTELEENEYWAWNYVLVLNTTYDCIGNYLAGLLFKPDFERRLFSAPTDGGKHIEIPFNEVVAWMPITPYEEKENGNTD